MHGVGRSSAGDRLHLDRAPFGSASAQMVTAAMPTPIEPRSSSAAATVIAAFCTASTQSKLVTCLRLAYTARTRPRGDNDAGCQHPERRETPDASGTRRRLALQLREHSSHMPTPFARD